MEKIIIKEGKEPKKVENNKKTKTINLMQLSGKEEKDGTTISD